jgi:putative holliday junction resolvase
MDVILSDRGFSAGASRDGTGQDSVCLTAMRWLCLDVGTRRVGVAVCDGGETVVTPLAAIPFGGPEALAVAVAALIRDREVEGIVLGLPVTRAGAGRGESRVKEVADVLRQRLGLPVELADERGTTRDAESLLEEAGAPRRRWAELVDGVAARLILERFLREQRVGAVDRTRREC